jgi:hypothetical protein
MEGVLERIQVGIEEELEALAMAARQALAAERWLSVVLRLRKHGAKLAHLLN